MPFSSLKKHKTPEILGFLVPVVGLEPTRMISPTDFESVTSANSITPAKFLFSRKSEVDLEVDFEKTLL